MPDSHSSQTERSPADRSAETWSADGARIRPGDAAYASLWVPDAARAQRFFAAVLGWPPIGHRVASGPAVDHGFAGGVEPATLFCNYVVTDLDAALGRVREAGGSHEPPDSQPWGPTAMCRDAEGLGFALHQPPTPAPGPRPTGESHGDLWYITMEVVDSSVARAFYGSVLGWSFVPGQIEDGWQTVDLAPMTGLHGGAATPTIVPMYRVDDIEAALRRVRKAGGTAPDARHEPYGWQALCADDQGTRFYLGQP